MKIASLSLDLDNQWSYMKTHGDAGWEEFPSYLDIAVPRVLSFLKERDLKITFFIIGQDAALEKNRDAIRSIADAGHEIANHSFNHEPWLHLYSRDELEKEFDLAEAAIEDATGQRPKGFRGPGFSLSADVLDVLAERGYEYDCSTMPSFLGPVARAFYLLRSPGLSAEERERLNKLFGRFRDGFGPLKPHLVGPEDKLIEIPVTTFPLLRAPIHASYLMYLLSFSRGLAMAYWHAALAACRVRGIEPSYLLHPLDFLDGKEIEAMKFFPGMTVASGRKIGLLDEAIGLLQRDHNVVTVGGHAKFAAGKLTRSATDLELKRA
ncbi:MAG: polysaccharide deacetylase family protein [Pyrinomonadaceae bacterium]